jgi:preprotein translocase subunit SecD
LLAVVILVMLISITGKETFHPGKWQSQFKVGLGLDLSSGTEVVLQAHTANGAPTQGAMDQAISVLLSRVNGTGNSGAQVQQQGPDLINVSIPGQPPENVLKLVSTTAKMAFRPVLLVEPYTAAATPNPVARPSSTATPSTSASAKASTNAQSERLASPAAASTATASTSATPTASTSATPTASASASPSATAATPTTYGDSSKVNAATLKLFNQLVCKPGPNSTTVNNSWKSTVGTP